MMEGHRTYLIAFAAIVMGVLETTDMVSILNDPKAGLTAAAMGLLMGVLRYVTQQTTVKTALYTEPPKPEPISGP